jgi:hypothetical protein
MFSNSCMKRLRLPLLVAVTLLLVLGAVLAVAFSSRFQTWAARRAVADQPGMTITLGSVSAGLARVNLRDVRVERDGAVLTLPSAEARLRVVSAVLNDRVLISELVAEGWTLDLTEWKPAAAPRRVVHVVPGGSAVPSRVFPGLISTAHAATPAAPATPPHPAPGFHGVFDQLTLPFDFALDGVNLAGEIILPASRGRVKLALEGGGLHSGAEGRFELSGAAALADPGVSALTVRGVATASMDSPRTLSQMTASIAANASGAKFPEGATLAVDLAAARETSGERYSAVVNGESRPLLTLEAKFPRAAQRLAGGWELDLRDTDLSPFALGKELPSFAASGRGNFDADGTFQALHAIGRIEATADELAVLDPSLEVVGAVMLAMDFDVVRQGETFAINQLAADVVGERPVATLRALQPFVFNPATGDLEPTASDGALLDIALDGLPLAWLNPHLGGFVATGDDLRGELTATPQAGGMALRTRGPLTSRGLNLHQAGQPLIDGVEFALTASADYTPHGWQAEIGELAITREGLALATLQAKAGQLTGAAQPIKATGRLVANLPEVLAQPVGGRHALALTAGDVSLEFIANLAAKKELQATIALENLAADPGLGVGTLPAISAEVRADLAADGQITLNLPLQIERDDRKSDLTIAGTMTPGPAVRTIVGSVTSVHLVLDDARIFAAIVPDESVAPAEAAQPSPWKGYAGTVDVELKKLVYSDTFHVDNVAGVLRLEEGALKIVGFRAGLGEDGEARVNGAVSFDAGAAEPFDLVADVVVTDFDPGPLLRMLMPEQPPTIEGRFNVNSTLAGRGDSLQTLVFGAGGNVQAISRGGVFRGLPVNVSSMIENTSRLAEWLASPLAALGALTGRRDYTEIAGRTAAAAEFARGLNPIIYDQLNVVLTRDAQLNATLENFTLISPELRLSGSGRMTRSASPSLLDDALAMEFVLKARGRQGELLEFLGALEAQTDDLGYAAFTVPVRIGGTVGSPDASEFSTRVAELALDRTGLSDKASELLNKIRGGK